MIPIALKPKVAIHAIGWPAFLRSKLLSFSV
jgi:hypothetical protein